DEIILPSDDQAAKFVSGIEGWADRHGRFYGNDEASARWSGATHLMCAVCGSLHKRQSYCRECAERKRVEKYQAMPRQEWDGIGMLFSDSSDQYFHDWEEVEQYCEDNECTLESLQLIICDPVYPR